MGYSPLDAAANRGYANTVFELMKVDAYKNVGESHGATEL